MYKNGTPNNKLDVPFFMPLSLYLKKLDALVQSELRHKYKILHSENKQQV